MYVSLSIILLPLVFAVADQCPPSRTINQRHCTVTCKQDRPGGDYASAYTGNFEACITACAKDSRCLTAQYHEANGYCYFKNSVNPATSSSGTDSVICSPAKCSSTMKTSTSPTCPKIPASTATSTVTSTTTVTDTLAPSVSVTTVFTTISIPITYTDTLTLTGSNTTIISTITATDISTAAASSTAIASASPTPDGYGCQDGVLFNINGMSFIQSCNADYPQGDLFLLQATSFQNCIDFCAVTDGCAGVVFDKAITPGTTSNNCFLKDDIQPYDYQPGSDSALLIV